MDWTSMAPQGQVFGPRGCVPDLDESVVPGRGEPEAIGGVGEAEDFFAVSPKRDPGLSGREIPELDRAVGAPRGERLAVGGISQTLDSPRVPGDRPGMES